MCVEAGVDGVWIIRRPVGRSLPAANPHVHFSSGPQLPERRLRTICVNQCRPQFLWRFMSHVPAQNTNHRKYRRNYDVERQRCPRVEKSVHSSATHLNASFNPARNLPPGRSLRQMAYLSSNAAGLAPDETDGARNK